MKANELTEGIYVYFNCFDGSKIIVKVTGFKDGVVYGVSEDGTHWCQISQIEPIPLTAEILEKNGFTKHAYGFSFQYLKLNGNLRNDDTVYFTITISGKDITIDYVHQLQHARRLCCIEQEIKL